MPSRFNSRRDPTDPDRPPRTRYAKVLLGMLRGLTDAEMAKEAAEAGNRSVPTALRMFWLVRLSMDDKLVPAPSDAEGKLDFIANC